MCKFGTQPMQIYGATKSDLYYQSVIDQVCRDPVCHIKKIRAKKIRYTGHEYGTHFSIEFLSKDNYVLGKFENVDTERVVERNWKTIMNWKSEVLLDKIICTLENDEHIVGVKLGISDIDENKNFVESFSFIIAKFKKEA